MTLQHEISHGIIEFDACIYMCNVRVQCMLYALALTIILHCFRILRNNEMGYTVTRLHAPPCCHLSQQDTIYWIICSWRKQAEWSTVLVATTTTTPGTKRICVSIQIIIYARHFHFNICIVSEAPKFMSVCVFFITM